MTDWKKGEQFAQQILESLGAQIEDVSANPTYWAQDVDMLARKDDKELKIEVKWDQMVSRYGNIFLETFSNLEKGESGWFIYSQADILWYGDSVNKLFYLYKLEDLRQYLDTREPLYIKKHTKQCHKDKNKTSEGLCIPVNELAHLCIAVIDINEALKEE